MLIGSPLSSVSLVTLVMLGFIESMVCKTRLLNLEELRNMRPKPYEIPVYR
jgi:hypothetical protein